MRRKWIFFTLAVMLLAAMATGGVAWAWGGPGHGLGWSRGHGDDGLSKLAGKVAEILGTDEQETADAIAQARSELRQEASDAALADVAGRVATSLGADEQETADALEKVSQEMYTEALENKLQKAIDDGRMTEEQAQQYRDNAASAGWHAFGYGYKGGDRDEFANRVGEELDVDGGDVKDAIVQALADIRSEALESRLQAAIDSGRITQEQADDIRERVDSGDWRGFGKRGHHGRNGFHGFRKGRGWKWGNASQPAATPTPMANGDST